jgi:hypothetical protein
MASDVLGALLGDVPPHLGRAGRRRRILGEARDRIEEADVDRLVCLRGKLELTGATCLDQHRGVAAISVIDAGGLLLVGRSAGLIALRCGSESLELVGEIGVVVGSREGEGLWRGEALRLLDGGTAVCARGMLRRRPRPPKSGYRGLAHGYALEAFGGFATIDVACARRPRRFGAALVGDVAAWASPFLSNERNDEPVVATRV